MSMLQAGVSPAERRRAREFAELLEGSRAVEGHELASLVALAATLRPASLAPRPEFRAALRAQLVAEAEERRPAAGAVPHQAGAERSVPETSARHKVRSAVVTGVLVSLVAGAGAAAASSHAVPGDSLYGLKRGIESVQLRLAHSDAARGHELLEQAEHRLTEAEALAASDHARDPETRATIADLLDQVAADTQAATEALDSAYADTGDDAPLRELDRFVVDQRERLADLSALLDPALRARLAAVTRTLAAVAVHLDGLLGSTGGATAAPTDLGSLLAVSRESGDGWAVSRVTDQVAATVSGLTSGSGGDSSATGGPVQDVVGGVTDTVGGVVGGVVGGTGGSSGGGQQSTGGATAAPGLPLPLPTSLPTSLPLPSSLPTTLPTSLPTLPSIPPVLPSGDGSGLPIPAPSVSICIKLPPLNLC